MTFIRVEFVQCSSTRAIYYLRFSTYKERLLNLGLDSLQLRRVKVDLLFCYKLLGVHGFVDIKSDDIFVISHYNNLRGYQCKLVKPMITSAHDANFFSNTLANICLPDDIVTADSISCFKHLLNSFDFSGYM